jgi:hypothetical protein
MTIPVKLPLFIETEPVEFVLVLTIDADRDGNCNVTIDAPELELRKFETFEKMMKSFDETDCRVVYGDYGTVKWEYVN